MKLPKRLLGILPLMVACADSPTQTGSLLGDQTITLSGRVVNHVGQPAPGIPVLIHGRPPTVSSSDGTFTVTGVTVPYDASVVVAWDKAGLTYRGLTRRDPTLHLHRPMNPSVGIPFTVTGMVSGGEGFPQPTGYTTWVTFSSALGSAATHANATTGAYTLTHLVSSWDGSSPLAGTIYALEMRTGLGGRPAAFTALGNVTGVTLTPGGSVTGQDIVLGTISNGVVSGTFSTSPGGTMSVRAALLLDGFRAGFGLTEEPTTSASRAFAFPIPDVAGVTMELLGSVGRSTATACCLASVSNLAWRRGVAPNSSGLTIAIPDSPTRTQPGDPASNVTAETLFGWTAADPGLHTVRFQWASGQPVFAVLTTASTTTVPDLRSIGLPMPAGARGLWHITGLSAMASVDAAAAATAPAPNDFFGSLSEGSQSGTGQWTFTTAP